MIDDETKSRLTGAVARWQDAMIAESIIEDALDEACPELRIGSIGTDPYDNSIEIYSEHLHEGHSGMPEAALEICKVAGFSQGWLNYKDGWEQYFGHSTGAGEIKKGHRLVYAELEAAKACAATTAVSVEETLSGPRLAFHD